MGDLSPSHHLLFFFLFLLSSLSSLFLASSDDTTAFVYAGCSHLQYTPGTPYQFDVDSLLTSLTNAAGFTSYANFTSSAASLSDPVYGLFQCRGDLPVSDCESCVRSALSQLGALCPWACGGALQLQGCFLRYGNDSFLGLPDTNLVYKKCGPSAGGSSGFSDFVGMRDEAMSAIVAAPQGDGTFRVGAAGRVQAAAQCIGDLSTKECAECVSDAVGQLKGSCGFAVSGDVYLGKCYAKYWTIGVDSSKSTNGDDTGKTLAIIIGLIAGIALFLILLSFIRRAGNDKY